MLQWAEVAGGMVGGWNWSAFEDASWILNQDGCGVQTWLKYYQYNHKLKQLFDCWNGGLSSNWALLIFQERKMLCHMSCICMYTRSIYVYINGYVHICTHNSEPHPLNCWDHRSNTQADFGDFAILAMATLTKWTLETGLWSQGQL